MGKGENKIQHCENEQSDRRQESNKPNIAPFNPSPTFALSLTSNHRAAGLVLTSLYASIPKSSFIVSLN